MYSKRTLLTMTIGLNLCLVLAQVQLMKPSDLTSLTGMQTLLELEAKFTENLRSYAIELEKKLHFVRGALIQLEAENQRALNQTEFYLSIPLNAFSLIRRMHQDWVDWKSYMNEPVGLTQTDFIEQHSSELPTSNNLLEGCLAIQRLQDVYDLKALDMATGLLNGKQYDTRLSALDTYEVGQHAYKNKNYEMARQWFNVTINCLLNKKLYHTFAADEANMLYMIGQSLVKMKYYSLARPIVKHALKLNSTKLEEKIFKLDAQIESFYPEVNSSDPIENPKKTQSNSTRLYNLGCRGEFTSVSKFQCQYKFGPSPFLRLAPLKMEVIMLDPQIKVFHEVLSPKEIHELITYARPLIKPASVRNVGKTEFKSTRTARGVWVSWDENMLTRRLVRRTEDMTDLNAKGPDQFQIINYNLGGHYKAHFDYHSIAKNKSKHEVNDRIATVLFYFTKVDQGGATVFPKLHQSFHPEPGMAIFWYNLHDDGTQDNQTLHGACPVLAGSKWVMTKWIKEHDQFLTRPCLKRQSTMP